MQFKVQPRTKKKETEKVAQKKFFRASRGKIDHAKSLFLTAKGTG